MQIKRFQARDMSEALRMVKQEFGQDAVILSARNLEKRNGFFGTRTVSGVEVTAALDVPDDLNFERRSALSRKQSGTAPAMPTPLSRTPYANVKPIRKKTDTTYPDPSKEASEGSSAGLSDEWSGAGGELAALHRRLLKQEVDDQLAWSIIEEVSRTVPDHALSPRGIVPELAKVLEAKGVRQVAMAPEPGKRRIVAMTGPTGVGKTTTIAKLAVRYALEEDREVGLITLDDERIGAIAQIEIYAKIIGVPLVPIYGPNDLPAALERLADREMIFVDTGGASPRDSERLVVLWDQLSQFPAVENHLIISASMREREMAEVIARFAQLPVKSLIFTKLDECYTYGAILNQVAESRLPLSFFTSGQQVPEDLLEASPTILAELLLPAADSGAEAIFARTAAESSRNAGLSDAGFGDGENIIYIANRNSDIFHHPDCKWARKMFRKNVTRFQNMEEALGRNFKPCKICLPSHRYGSDYKSSGLEARSATG